ncbi:uncharacterized protein LOC143458892 isoform X1 [Clavelina lepadiformis]|uniref:uncharacterized protein LOC143458892 isoform X1 n=1 Tax=Clavelina lepadiformis TaxID=159417 RepID=UPI0040435F7E
MCVHSVKVMLGNLLKKKKKKSAMNTAKRLFNPDMKYAEVIGEFRQFSKDDVNKILKTHKSFVEWLVDPSVNGFEPSMADELLQYIHKAIKDKIDVGLTAVVSIRLDEMEARLMHAHKFVSVDFLRKMFVESPQFDLKMRNGAEYVMKAKISSGQEKPIDLLKHDTSIKSSDHKLDPRKEQLSFLYRSHPDVVAALQKGVTMQCLVKAFNSWKSLNLHSNSNFIAWLLDLAKYNCSQKNTGLTFNAYLDSLQLALVMEAQNYVSGKPRTPAELVPLVSRAQCHFVDIDFLTSAIEKFPQHLELKASESAFKSSLVYRVSRPDDSSNTEPRAQFVIPIPAAKKRNENDESLQVADKDIEVLNTLPVSDDVWSLCTSLLSTSVTWPSIVSSLSKIDVGFMEKMANTHKCFMYFLIELAERYKPQLDNKEYITRLMTLVKNKVFLLKLLSKPATLQKVTECLNDCCGLVLVDCDFMRKTFQNFKDRFQLDNDQVFARDVVASLLSPVKTVNVSPARTTSISLDDIKAMPRLKQLITPQISFIEFLIEYQQLSMSAKICLKNFSQTFYSLLLSVARCTNSDLTARFEHRLNNVIASEIRNFISARNASSFRFADIHLKLTNGDVGFLDCSDMKYVVTNCSNSNDFFIDAAKTVLSAIPLPDPLLSNIEPRLASEGKREFGYMIDDFATCVTNILRSDLTSKHRLKKLYQYLKEIPGNLMTHILEIYGTKFQFILYVVPNSTELCKILRHKILDEILSETVSCDEILGRMFDEVHYFINEDLLIAFLQKYRDDFVVVGNLVAAVRKTSPLGYPVFKTQLEEKTFTFCEECFPADSKRMSLNKFLQTVWEFGCLSQLQREFIFGKIASYSGIFEHHMTYFRRYLLMYPAVFSVEDNHVFYKFRNISPNLSHNCDSNSTVIIIDSYSDGEIRESPPHHIVKRSKKKKKRKVSKKHTRHSSKDRLSRKKKKRSTDDKSACHKPSGGSGLTKIWESISKKHLDCNSSHGGFESDVDEVQHDAKEPLTNESPDYTSIDLLTNSAIHHIALGKFAASHQTVSKIEPLAESLAADLFTSPKDKKSVRENTKFKGHFISKIGKALSNSENFELVYNTFDDKPVEVRVVQEAPAVVIKRMSFLTGVSDSRLKDYLFQLLKTQQKPLDINLLFTKIHQRFREKKVSNDTPNNIIQCQAVGCMKKNSAFFVNAMEGTVCLKKKTMSLDESQSIQNAAGQLSDKTVNDFITTVVEDKCLRVDEVLMEVEANFSQEFTFLCTKSVKLIVLGLIAENDRVGFTLDGKVAKQRIACKGKRRNTQFDSSSDELKMDLSEDDSPMLPDSTNQHTCEDILNKMGNDYIEGEVIRNDSCPPPKRSRKTTNSFDSATSESTVNSPNTSNIPVYTPPRDPRLHGKVVEQMKTAATKTSDPVGSSSSTLLSDAYIPVDSQNSTSDPSTKRSADKKSGRPSVSANKKSHSFERTEKLKSFATKFLFRSNFSVQTDQFIKAAKEQFKNERFTASELAFEAYVRDFVALSNNDFYFADKMGGLGVTYTGLRHFGAATYRSRVTLPFADLLDEVRDTTHSYLSGKPDNKEKLDSICDFIAVRFSDKFTRLHPAEVKPICRNLILISAIRNVEKFMFGRHDSGLSLRQDRTKRSPTTPPKITSTTSTVPSHAPASSNCNKEAWKRQPICQQPCLSSTMNERKENSSPHVVSPYPKPSISDIVPDNNTSSDLPRIVKMRNADTNTKSVGANVKISSNNPTTSNKVAALKLLADIIRRNGSCSKSRLRDLWTNEADKSVRKVFGSGVSFALSLRKFETIFPIADDGKVFINENALKQFLKRNT